MADMNSLDEIIGTKDGMEVLVNNSAHDDDTMTFVGADFLSFLGRTVSNLYVSGNSWFGFGVNSVQLAVGNRDTKMWYFIDRKGQYSTIIISLRSDGKVTRNTTAHLRIWH